MQKWKKKTVTEGGLFSWRQSSYEDQLLKLVTPSFPFNVIKMECKMEEVRQINNTEFQQLKDVTLSLPQAAFVVKLWHH